MIKTLQKTAKSIHRFATAYLDLSYKNNNYRSISWFV